MKGNKILYIVFALVTAIGIWIMADTFSQPSVNDLEGNFKEVAFYRNENNTGPIIRVFAVTVSDTLWNEMKQYGEFMQHTKYGNTKVYFFSDQAPFPEQVNPAAPNIAQEFQQHCLALYEKASMGQVSFTKYPFRK